MLHNFLGTLNLFPSLPLTKILDMRLCYMPPFLVHRRRRLLNVHYCDNALSVVRPSSLTFHILDFSSETTERISTKHDRKKNLIVLYQACVFPGSSEKQDSRPGWSVKKVALCSQVHDIWPFGPLVLSWIYSSCFTLYIGKLRILCKPSARYLFIDNMFKVMVHFDWYIDTYIF